MTDAINQVNAARLLQPTQLGTTGSAGPDSASGKEFKQLLMDSLQQVNQLQQEADAKVENLVTGQSDNVVEVFSAVRKADVAFSLLMEIRNKMLDAYQEIQQMRISLGPVTSDCGCDSYWLDQSLAAVLDPSEHGGCGRWDFSNRPCCRCRST